MAHGGQFVATVTRAGGRWWPRWHIEVWETTAHDGVVERVGEPVAQRYVRGDRDWAADAARRLLNKTTTDHHPESFTVHHSGWKPAHPPARSTAAQIDATDDD